MTWLVYLKQSLEWQFWLLVLLVCFALNLFDCINLFPLVPDLVTSIIVIKKTGTASMGICAGIASNIFAILLGLGLPWGIQCLLIWIKSGTYATSMVMLHSSALPYTSIILLATIVALYFTFRISKWEISKRFSLICVLIHVVFVISSTYLEIYVS